MKQRQTFAQRAVECYQPKLKKDHKMGFTKQIKKHHSPFKRVKVTEEGGHIITDVQRKFHALWRDVTKHLEANYPEKKHMTQAMQEACMWATRAIAIEYQTEDNFNKDFQRKPDAPAEARPEKEGVKVVIKRSKLASTQDL
jgi:hypothetical protein